MAALHVEITPELQAFIVAQPMFFVASAPLSGEGHVNLSPKGLDTFRILSPTCVAYLDFVGSGNETAAHVLENGRITFMFCAFEGPPKIVRLYGRGRTVQPRDAQWADLSSNFPQCDGVRQIMIAEISRVQTSCGFGVPRMRLEDQRDALFAWVRKKGPDGLVEYQSRKNRVSIDGLPTGM
ncbi:MAG TPA: pyridoxamine 5'-phosphate oxidase family protein [Humisphaera sp.]|nr:pyridoxamine 5'-phosphate oxidase family protein [Humisphaera sp.]